MSTEQSLISSTLDTGISYATSDVALTHNITKPIDDLNDKVQDLNNHLQYLESRLTSFESEFMHFLQSGYFRGTQLRINPNQPYQPNPQTLNQPVGYPTFADLDKIKDQIADVSEQVSKLTNDVETYINN